MYKILLFGAPWCHACKAQVTVLEDVIDTLIAEGIDVTFEYIDIEVQKHTAVAMGVKSLPTMILTHEGDELDRMTAAADATALYKWVNYFEGDD